MEKLYIVVRQDLPAGAQAAQCCHALRAFAHAHPDLDRQWHESGGNIVILSVPNRVELADLTARAQALHISTAEFHESDLGDELTAAAFAASARKLLSSLPLGFREFCRAA